MADSSLTAEAAAPFNRRRRGVLGGLVLVAVGITFLLPQLGVQEAVSYLFVILGLAFAASYVLSLNPYVYLVPAAILISFGVGLLIPRLLRLPGEFVAPVFLGSLAVGLIVVFAIRPMRRWPLIPAAILALVAIAQGLGVTLVPQALEPLFVPVVLIAIGGWLIVAPRLG